jgi:hypothetical protein
VIAAQAGKGKIEFIANNGDVSMLKDGIDLPEGTV